MAPATKKTHILCFPFPAKGHINPMLHLANRLISKGLMVTLVTTTSTIKSIKPKATSLMNIEAIADGYEESEKFDVDNYFERFRTAAAPSLNELIGKLKESNNSPPKVVVYDSMMPWVLDIAHGLRLQGACFFTQSCSVSAVYYHMLQETSPLKDSNSPLPSIDMNNIGLPYFEYFDDPNQTVVKLHHNQFSNINNMDYILFNTFYKLESEVVNWMAAQWPIKTVGPTAPLLSNDKKQSNGKEEGNNYLFETNTETCLKWLDQRETGSVVYVSMGSLAKLSEEQMKELGQGLVSSDCHFLWVVRSEEESKLPEKFKLRTSEKGLIVNWCPQLDVLAHRAVACFMTHCGWNSTIEALISGVPMIAVPQWIDQTTNAKFVVDVWKTGVQVQVDEKGFFTRQEMERCITQVTQSDKGNEIKRNSIKWKTLAKEAVEKGGSSDTNFEEFASTLLIIQ